MYGNDYPVGARRGERDIVISRITVGVHGDKPVVVDFQDADRQPISGKVVDVGDQVDANLHDLTTTGSGSERLRAELCGGTTTHGWGPVALSRGFA
jgi:hypothetical protein